MSMSFLHVHRYTIHAMMVSNDRSIANVHWNVMEMVYIAFISAWMRSIYVGNIDCDAIKGQNTSIGYVSIPFAANQILIIRDAYTRSCNDHMKQRTMHGRLKLDWTQPMQTEQMDENSMEFYLKFNTSQLKLASHFYFYTYIVNMHCIHHIICMMFQWVWTYQIKRMSKWPNWLYNIALALAHIVR